MASERQIAANRRNALKSTGPRTEAGKARSRRNAITHGLNAHIETLPDDEKGAFEERLTAWKATFQPCTPYEEDLIRRLAGYSWRLDRAERVQTALIADSVDEAAEADIRQKRESFGDAARRLLPDFAPEGAPEPEPAPRRQIGEYLYQIDDPDDPLFLVMQLERVADGCRWMRDRWAELRAILDAGKAWTDPELTRALRLTGHRPLDAAEDHGVLEIIVANYVVDRSRPDPFSALWDGLNQREMTAYRQRLIGRRLKGAMPESPEAARDFLLDLVDEAAARLEAIEAELRAQDAELAEVRPLTHLFDDSVEGRWLRSKQHQYNHAVARIVSRFTRARRRGQAMTADPPPRRRPEKPRPAPPRIVDEKPRPWISPRDLMAKERRKKGVRWRTYRIPPWRRPGGRTLYKHYPGYPAPPQPVRRRRKMSAERKRRMARNFIKLFQSLGLWTVLIALFLPAAGSPGLADGQRPRTTADQQIFHHEWHKGHESDRPSHSCPSCHSWSLLRIAAGSHRGCHGLHGGHESNRPSHSCPSGHSWSSIRLSTGAVVRVSTADRKTFNHEFHEPHESDRPSHSCPSCHSWSILATAAGSHGGSRPKPPAGQVGSRSVVPVSTADQKTLDHEWHEGHESDRTSHSCPSCHSWSILPIAAGSAVCVGRNAPAGPVFRVSAAFTPGKTQNEPNFGRVSGFVAAAKPASAHPRDRSRGPPMPQIAAISVARPPPMALLTGPC